MIGQSEKSGIEIESEYQLTGHPVYWNYRNGKCHFQRVGGKHLIHENFDEFWTLLQILQNILANCNWTLKNCMVGQRSSNSA